MDGASEVNLVGSPYRINSFRIIATGTGNAASGAISLKAQGAGTTRYSYITAGYTRARNIIYTVPANRLLHINKIDVGYGANAANKQEYCRVYTRANREPTTQLSTGSIFYSYSEAMLGNGTAILELKIPTKFAAGTDIKVSGIASGVGVATVVLRGWLETT